MAALSAPILLDGSHGEGGGALFRTAIAMAALTQQPLRVQGVRGGTKWPGLNPEDLAVLRAMAQIASAEVVGATAGSHEVSFLPTGRPRAMNERLAILDFDGYAGFACAPLVATALLPLLARTGSYSILDIEGETYGTGILTYDYFANATLGALRRLGLYAYADLAEAGFGRGSRGDMRLEVEPSALSGVDWGSRGKLVAVRAVVATAELPAAVGERGISHLEKLAHHARLDLQAEAHDVPSRSSGAHVTVWAEFERGWGGATAMGQKGVRIEAVAQNSFDHFLSWMSSDSSVDAFLADQIVLPAALAEGDSTLTVHRLTQRFLTTVWVIKQFLPIRITVKGAVGEAGTVTIRR